MSLPRAGDFLFSHKSMSESEIVVVKHGTSVVQNRLGTGLDQDRINRHLYKHVEMHQMGFETVEVASGAVMAGIEYAIESGLDPTTLSTIQLAKMGTARQMVYWQTAGRYFGLAVEQVLATHDEISDAAEGSFIVEGIRQAAALGILSVVNENNATGNYETKLLEMGIRSDGDSPKADNDWLAAHLAISTNAKKLLLLTNTNGLLDGHEVVSEIRVDDIPEYLNICNTKDPSGTGGMKEKLTAAGRAASDGIEVLIANAFAETYDLLEGNVGTRVVQ